MKASIIAVLAIMLVASPLAYGLLDDNSTTAAAGAVAGAAAGAISGAAAGASADSTNLNTAFGGSSRAYGGDADQDQVQGQQMGQLQGQASLQGNRQDTTNKNRTYVMTSPNTTAGDGQSAVAGYSIFGGLNIAESAEYKVCIEKIIIIDQMVEAGLMSAQEGTDEAAIAFAQLKDASQPKRWLAIGPRTRGRHIFNLFGILATDANKDINIDVLFGVE